MINEKDDHYMGYLVLQTDDDKNYLIIDGQQRFTTVTILILAAIKCIKGFVGVALMLRIICKELIVWYIIILARKIL